ncbi:MAG: DUF4854 domain-containing protein [Oscillospiraceae bacterium]|nr:DUF4854 domain-containing protein [Oscillospiraceae bacterium]
MKKVLSVIAVLILVVSLTACGEKTAEGFAADINAEAGFSELQASVEAMGMLLTITGENNTIIYTYTFKDELDVDTARAGLESQEETLRTTSVGLIAGMKDYGIKNPAVRYVYCNNDGTEIWAVTFD